ncbi:hypothetical protein FB446DRAFT_710234, partial [Lentinula raphanica]
AAKDKETRILKDSLTKLSLTHGECDKIITEINLKMVGLQATKDREIQTLHDSLTQSTQDHAGCSGAIVQLEKRVSDLQATKDQEIQNINASLEQSTLAHVGCNGTISELEKTVATKDQEIQNLNASLSQSTLAHADCERNITGLSQQVTALQTQAQNQVPNNLDWVARGTYDAKARQLASLQETYDKARKSHENEIKSIEAKLGVAATKYHEILNETKNLQALNAQLEGKIKGMDECSNPKTIQSLKDTIASKQLNIEILTKEIHTIR